MKIIIAGAGNVGTHLAKLLSGEKQDIILMDEDDEKLEKMGNNLDLMLVNYSPTSINGLKEAGVAGADLFIAVTPDESRNMTACMLATNLGAKKTVARIDNYEYLLPKNKEFFAKLGVHSLIYPEMLATVIPETSYLTQASLFPCIFTALPFLSTYTSYIPPISMVEAAFIFP